MTTDHILREFQKLDHIPISFGLYRLKSLEAFHSAPK